MSTTELKTDIHILVDNVNDNDVLNKVYELLSELKSKNNETFSLSPAEKKAIDEALESVEKEGVIPHDKVMEELKKKYPSLIK